VKFRIFFLKKIFFSAQLESEYKSIHIQYEDRCQSMATELYGLQESIMIVAFDVDELRTRLEKFIINGK
jgi:hypothetical protein